MKLNEIADFVFKYYPNSYFSTNNAAYMGREDEECEDYLIDKLLNFFSYELLHICGCGRPENTYEIIRRILSIRYEYINGSLEFEDIAQRYEEDLQLDHSNNIHYGLMQFVLYMLDYFQFVEHGSGIYGCWLTDLGEMYLTVLNAWHVRNEKQIKKGEKKQ